MLDKARELSKIIHENQFRISGENYFVHVERVIRLLQNNNVTDVNLLTAAYLHHALDIDKSIEKVILDTFGAEVLQIVKEYKKLSESDIKSIKPGDVNEKFIVQTYLNIANSPAALIIRLADKVDNIKTAFALPKDQSINLAEKAVYLYAPICRLLGIQTFVKVLENEGFKILSPRDFYQITEYLQSNLPNIQEKLVEAKSFLLSVLEEKGINAQIDYRIKHIYSIYKKAIRKSEESLLNLDKLYDIAAMRILVETVEQCYETEDILKKVWDSLENEREDYIQQPKPNGYKSLHDIFKIGPKTNLEIQIRTKEMHAYNEYGLASHAFYKIGETIKSKLQKSEVDLKTMHYLLPGDTLKINQFSNNVYVFTPKGDIKELPKGSNIIDFAYSIHKDLGNSCIGGIINGEFEPASYELRNGDRVEVKTIKNKKKPSADWLDIVKTRKAKEEIKKALREIIQF